MIGQRGVPATFGGIEHHVEEVGSRLVARGHDVTVFCRPNYVRSRSTEHHGMRLRYIPTVGTKHLDALVHSAFSTIAAVGTGYDIIHYHALGPGTVAAVPRYISSAKVVQTVHGLDSERAKWGPAARQFLTMAAWMSARVPDATIVVSRALVEHYKRRYGRSVTYIPNGVRIPQRRDAHEISRRFGLTEGSYFLFVGRFVPEKAPDFLIRAFRRVTDDIRLVLAGGSSFTDAYDRSLHDLAAEDGRVIFAGYVYGPLLDELYTNAAAFVIPSTLEGLPLTLLEAASYGVPVIASAIPPHKEILGADGPGRRLVPPMDEEALAAALRATIHQRDVEAEGASMLREHVLRTYRWDEAVDATEQAYHDTLRSTHRTRV